MNTWTNFRGSYFWFKFRNGFDEGSNVGHSFEGVSFPGASHDRVAGNNNRDCSCREYLIKSIIFSWIGYVERGSILPRMARPSRRRPLPTGRIDGYPPTELSWSRLKKLRLYNTVICKSSRWLTIIAGWNCADGRPSIPAKLAVGITVSPLILFEQRFTSIWGTLNDNISGDGDTHTFWREIHKYLGNFKWLYVCR